MKKILKKSLYYVSFAPIVLVTALIVIPPQTLRLIIHYLVEVLARISIAVLSIEKPIKGYICNKVEEYEFWIKNDR